MKKKTYIKMLKYNPDRKYIPTNKTTLQQTLTE